MLTLNDLNKRLREICKLHNTHLVILSIHVYEENTVYEARVAKIPYHMSSDSPMGIISMLSSALEKHSEDIILAYNADEITHILDTKNQS
jgi:hypothetical protein